MVNRRLADRGRRELLRLIGEGKRASDEIVEQTPELLDDLRDLLPLSRGGSPPDKTSPTRFVYEDAEPIPLRPSFDPPEVPKVPAINPGSGFAAAFERKRQQEARQMTTEDTIRDMVNDPLITLTQDMLPIINDPSILMDRGMNLVRNQFAQFVPIEQKKKKKKVSKYQKELGRQLKLLKKKHPRIPITRLMKKAHAATRKALK